MESVIVEIRLPGTNAQSDFLLPAYLPLGDVLEELVALLSAGDAHIGIDQTEPLLLDLDQQLVLDGTSTLAAQGVKDGACLMLL